MDTFDKIFKNHDVLESIFKYLNLREQLKISQICETFNFVITHLIWRSKLKDLKITEPFSGSLIVKCRKTHSTTSMNYEMFEEFLELLRTHLEHIELQFIEFDKEITILNCVNLTKIHFNECKIRNKIIQQLAKNCLKLKCLKINLCKNQERKSLVMGKDIDVRIFQEFKELSEFIYITHGNTKMDYQILCEFYKIPKLKILCIKSGLILAADCKLKEEYGKFENCLETLTIEYFEEPLTWFKFTSLENMKQLKNLTKLCLNLNPCSNLAIGDVFINTLANNCVLLQDLTLERCKLFITNKFPAFTKLSSLNLYWCWGLSGNNLTDIFQECNLKDFVINNTFFCKNFNEQTYSSSTLERLTLNLSRESDITLAFTNYFNSFNNVQKFVCSLNGPRNFTDKLYSLENISKIFPNLEELLLKDYYISIGELKRLEYLKILQLDFCSSISCSYIQEILKLPNICQLFLNSNCFLNDNFDFNENSDLQTNMELLVIPLCLLNLNVEFWMKYLQRNKKLKLTAFNWTLNDNCLTKLLKYKYFSSHLKYINICGYYFGK